MELIRKVFKFEEMSFDYINQQLEGLCLEIAKPEEYQHLEYVEEKIDNIRRHFDSIILNFGQRIRNKGIQKEWKEFDKKLLLDAL